MRLYLEVGKKYQRFEDMSPDGRIIVMQQEDGDVGLIIIAPTEDGSLRGSMSVEFCMPMLGGGQSPHTRQALIDLADAIERDNEENPQNRGVD